MNLLADYPDEAFCTTSTPTDNEKATAKLPPAGDGSVCRRNGVDYGTGAGYRYPDATYKNRVGMRGNPYYYTISSVQFCSSSNAKSWGTGACQSRWSSTSKWVSYGAGGFDPAAFTRVDITPSVTNYPSGRTYAQEMANFARWFAFARTRLLAMKTAAGIAFASPSLDGTTHVGFHTLNTFATMFLNVKDFTGSDKTAWFNNLYTVDAHLGRRRPAPRCGGSANTSRGAARPGRHTLPGATDPLATTTGKCQPNYHLLATDGYVGRQRGAEVCGTGWTIGDSDLTVPALPAPVAGFTPGSPFPPPYIEGRQRPRERWPTSRCITGSTTSVPTCPTR